LRLTHPVPSWLKKSNEIKVMRAHENCHLARIELVIWQSLQGSEHKAEGGDPCVGLSRKLR
jgi:hypothetical protein